MPQYATSLRCPACNEDLEGNLGRVPAAIDGDTVRVAIECCACSTQLELAGLDGVTIAPVGQG